MNAERDVQLEGHIASARWSRADTRSASTARRACVHAVVAAASCAIVGALAPSTASAGEPPLARLGADDVRELSASSSAAGGRAQAAIDGDVTTVWSSAPDDTIGASLSLDFASTRYVTVVELFPVRRNETGSTRFVGRPSRVRVTVGDQRREIDLPDTAATRSVTWPSAVPTGSVRLEVLGLHGNFRRVGLADVRVYEPQDVLAADPELAARVRADVDRLIAAADEVTRRQIVAYGLPALPVLAELVAERCDAVGLPTALAATHGLSASAARRAIGELLAGGDVACVDAALRFLERHPVTGVEDALLRVSGGDDPARALRAAELLARSRDPRVQPILEQRFATDPDTERAARAAELLSTAFGRDGVAAIERRVKAGDARRREVAVKALARLPDEPDAVAALERISGGQDVAGASLALGAIAGMAPAQARATLEPIIVRDPARRAAALAAMVEHDLIDPVALTWLDWVPASERSALVDGLGGVASDGARRVLAAIVVALPQRPVQVLASDALLRHGRDGLQALVATVDRHPSRAWAAEDHVARAAERAPDLVAEVLAGVRVEARLDDLIVGMMEGLAVHGGAAHVEPVFRMYRHPDATPRLRVSALDALARLPSGACVARITDDLGRGVDALDPLRYAVLAHAGDAETRRDVFDRIAATDPDTWSSELVLALGRVDPARALTIFGDRYIFLPKRVQMALLEVAHLARSGAGLEILFRAATSTDGALRRRALQWLSRTDVDDLDDVRVGQAERR